MELIESSLKCNVNSRVQLDLEQEKDVLVITSELAHKLTQSKRSIRKIIAPFYWKVKQAGGFHCFSSPIDNDWEFSNPSFYVKLPFNKFKFKVGDKVDSKNNRWNKIVDILNILKAVVVYWRDVDVLAMDSERVLLEFQRAICSYCDKSTAWWSWWDLEAIAQDDALLDRFLNALPGIIDHAVKLPARLEQPIPMLRMEQNHTLCLSRDLVCSLLANAFLCTFPDPENHRPYFNFYWLFSSSWRIPWGTKVKGEKIKSFLEYFEQMEMSSEMESPLHPNSVITFERRCYRGRFDWVERTKEQQLCEMEIVAKGKNDQTEDIIQIDFTSSSAVGGGVLGHDAGEEEIRFCINPELLVALLFTEKLLNDEALVITGTSQFSSYSGYRETFTWKELKGDETARGWDCLGRGFSQVVLMRFHQVFPVFRLFEMNQQQHIRRIIHQCYVAFAQDRDHYSTPVTTGNWGCGAMWGDPQLKFLAQWMAASVHQRRVLYQARDNRQRKEFENMAALLLSNQVSVSKLYSILIKFGTLVHLPFKKGVFDFVMESL